MRNGFDPPPLWKFPYFFFFLNPSLNISQDGCLCVRSPVYSSRAPRNSRLVWYNNRIVFVYYFVVETTKQIRASIILLFCVCIGGATPGKLIMGLKIVKCNQIVPLGINRVQVGSRYVDIYSCNFTVEILEIGNNVLFALSYCHWSRLLDNLEVSKC